MNTLEDEVRSVITGFMNSGELFTALDVSNKVKLTFPFARHREVRDVVRSLFATFIEPAGWSRTPITVTLADGSTAEALLYHCLSDTWDLDNKYDAQKRQQGTLQQVQVVVQPATPTVVNAVVPAATPSAAPVSAGDPSLTPAQANDRWLQLFNSQPSLFPLK